MATLVTRTAPVLSLEALVFPHPYSPEVFLHRAGRRILWEYHKWPLCLKPSNDCLTWNLVKGLPIWSTPKPYLCDFISYSSPHIFTPPALMCSLNTQKSHTLVSMSSLLLSELLTSQIDKLTLSISPGQGSHAAPAMGTHTPTSNCFSRLLYKLHFLSIALITIWHNIGLLDYLFIIHFPTEFKIHESRGSFGLWFDLIAKTAFNS